MSTIVKNANWYNPMFFEGRELTNIVIYKDGKIIYESKCGWFGHGTNNSIDKIEFPFEIKKANKLNLDRKDAFFHKGVLYLHQDLLDIKQTDSDVVICESWTSKMYGDKFELTLPHVICNGKEFKDSTFTTNLQYIKRHEETEEWKESSRLSQEMKELGIRVDEYDARKILQHYQLIKK